MPRILAPKFIKFIESSVYIFGNHLYLENLILNLYNFGNNNFVIFLVPDFYIFWHHNFLITKSEFIRIKKCIVYNLLRLYLACTLSFNLSYDNLGPPNRSLWPLYNVI